MVGERVVEGTVEAVGVSLAFMHACLGQAPPMYAC